MFDKRLLIVPALVVSTVVAGTIYLSSDKNTSQLTVSAGTASYYATIDVAHPLLPTQDEETYAFRLNNAGAYSALYVPQVGALSTTLPEGYEDYAFSFTAENRTFFEMILKEFEEWSVDTDYKIGGVWRTLWGIPNPTKVELVYNGGEKNLSVDTEPSPADRWGNKQTVDLQNGDKSISYTVTDPSKASTYWATCIDTDGGGTIYVRSMTIWYTCS